MDTEYCCIVLLQFSAQMLMRKSDSKLSTLLRICLKTSPMMNAPAKPDIAQYNPPASMPPQAEPLAQYLAQRDLVSSILYQFEDKP